MKHVIGFSGGVDSQATLIWMRKQFGDENVIALNSQAGRNESSHTVEFVKRYSETVFPIIEVVPLIKDLGGRGTRPGQCRDRRQEFSDDDELTFDILAYIKGRFPSRKAQFCTEHLKLAPQKRWQEENLRAKGIEFDRFVGVRRDESRTRCAALETEWDNYFKCQLYRPIVHWSKDFCFAYCKMNGEEFNPLYKLGFNRVGCAPCINSGKDDVRNWQAREPEMIEKIRRWEKRVGRTFFAPIKKGRINFVDDVLRWTETERGGKQLGLKVLYQPQACESKYGLCE